jgi:Tol biopolymer transport system component
MQNNRGGALSFSPDGTYLAVSTTDHIDVIDLRSGVSSTVVNYPALTGGYFPEVVWSVDSRGFKCVIPPSKDTDQAQFLFVFAAGQTASLAKFMMLITSGSQPFISPDGGYVIFTARLGDGKEALYLMDSSGAAKITGEPADRIRALGWLPDSKHFVYEWSSGERTILLVGQVTGEPPVEVDIKPYETIRWIDAESFLGLQNGNLYLGDINGGEILIADNVSDFDFGH